MGAGVTEVAGRKIFRGRSQRNSWQRLKSDLPSSAISHFGGGIALEGTQDNPRSKS